MTGFDIIVLLLMGGGAVFGFLRGFVQEVLALATWLLVIIVIRYAHASATDLLVSPVGNAQGAAVLAFAVLFILTYAFGKTLAARIGKRTRSSLIGPVDRVLGFGFGLVKGLLVATLIYLLIMLVYDTLTGKPGEPPEWLREARTYTLLHASGALVVDLMEQHRGAGEPVEGMSEATMDETE